MKMTKSEMNMAREIAEAALAFERQRTGNFGPKSVTVVLNESTLVITLHEALSPAEKALACSPEGAAEVREFHQQLFATSSDALRQEIKRITGMEVREATTEVEPASGAVVQAFTNGAVVQVYQLAGSAPTQAWSTGAQGDPSIVKSQVDGDEEQPEVLFSRTRVSQGPTGPVPLPE